MLVVLCEGAGQKRKETHVDVRVASANLTELAEIQEKYDISAFYYTRRTGLGSWYRGRTARLGWWRRGRRGGTTARSSEGESARRTARTTTKRSSWR